MSTGPGDADARDGSAGAAGPGSEAGTVGAFRADVPDASTGTGADVGSSPAGLPVGGDGIFVGSDAEGQQLSLGVHRPAPYDVLLIGGLWTAQVLALRTARAGAGVRVAVETARAPAWAGVAQAGSTADARWGGGGGTGRVELFEVGRVPVLGAVEGRPVLVVRDCGMRPPRGRVRPAPWQTVVTLLPYLSPVAPRLIRESALVGVQQVSPEEAARLGRLLGLSAEETGALPGLDDGVTLWCAGRDRQWAATAPVGDEEALLGPPRRMEPATRP
ncbi:hypothetical protein [Streptomyces candidus]|uniref:Uncharacterized protein n=1 Tax=Streptomyces candidus TaxID=67283 RepID=A0A7X0LRS1_9ACTN|nr:hypothetical protein [Streptomyces candidus]MBB6438435.1 hypothetical protein [Streptomyces candidus]